MTTSVACKLDSCIHFSERGRLNCGHKESSKQDVRPEKPSDCKYFDTRLELILRKGKYFIGNSINGIEVEYDQTASAFSDEGEKKLDAMANKLRVRRKDIFAVSLAILKRRKRKASRKREKRQRK